MVVKLVEPDEVPGYWQQWKEALEPVISRAHRLIEIAKAERERLGG
jgi:hypothetical protein